jgi:hypothetical protein
MQYVAAKLLLNYFARPGRRFVAPRVISLRRGNSVAFGAKRKSGPFMSTRPSSSTIFCTEDFVLEIWIKRGRSGLCDYVRMATVKLSGRVI